MDHNSEIIFCRALCLCSWTRIRWTKDPKRNNIDSSYFLARKMFYRISFSFFFLPQKYWLLTWIPTRTLSSSALEYRKGFSTHLNFNNSRYYTLNSVTLFWLAESVRTVNFRNQLRIVQLSCQGHSRSPVIVSISRALCCFLSVTKQRHDFLFFFVQCSIIKQLLDSVFVVSRIIKVSVPVISLTSLSLRLQLITLTYLDLDHSGYHENLIQ